MCVMCVLQQIEKRMRESSSDPSIAYALAIHSDVLRRVMSGGGTEDEVDERSISERFFRLAGCMHAVVACRLEPRQKADIVTAVMERSKRLRGLAATTKPR